MDYHIIELLYFDPNHLTFGDSRFNIPQKMSYTVSPFYNIRSENINSLSDYKFDVEPNINAGYEKYKDMIQLIVSELFDEKISENEALKLLKECEGERRNEK